MTRTNPSQQSNANTNKEQRPRPSVAQTQANNSARVAAENQLKNNMLTNFKKNKINLSN